MRNRTGRDSLVPMDAALGAVAEMHGGVFTRQQALTCGVSDIALLGLVRGGEITSLGRSAYAVSSALPDTTLPGHDVAYHRLKARAAQLVYPDAVLCGVSLLAMSEIDIYGADLRRVELARTVPHEVLTQVCRIRPLHSVVRPRPPKDMVPRGAGVSEAIAGALVQVAMDHGILAGVCSADDAMHDAWTTAEDITSAVNGLAHWSRSGRAQAMVPLMDAGSGSVGESRLRVTLLLGGIPVVSQHLIRVGRTVVACCDLKVRGSMLVIEFDGKVKYRSTDGEALWKEKKREDGIRRTKHVVERVIWPELDHEALLLARMRAAVAEADPDPDDRSAPEELDADPTKKLG